MACAPGYCSSWALGTGLTVVAHGLCCSVASGILPDQGSNPGLLRWQVDSLSWRRQGSPGLAFVLWALRILDYELVIAVTN